MVNVDRSCVSLNVDCLDDTGNYYYYILLACIGIALGIIHARALYCYILFLVWLVLVVVVLVASTSSYS